MTERDDGTACFREILGRLSVDEIPTHFESQLGAGTALDAEGLTALLAAQRIERLDLFQVLLDHGREAGALGDMIWVAAETDPEFGGRIGPFSDAAQTAVLDLAGDAKDDSPAWKRATEVIWRLWANGADMSGLEEASEADVRARVEADPEFVHRLALGGGFRTALQIVARAHRPDLVRVLLDAGADPNASSWLRAGPLWAAAAGEWIYGKERGVVPGRVAREFVLRMLVEAGADPCDNSHGQGSLLSVAVGLDDLELLHLLYSLGGELDAADADGCTPLHRCISGDEVREEMLAELLRMGADPHHRCPVGNVYERLGWLWCEQIEEKYQR